MPIACRIAALKDMGFSLAAIRETLLCDRQPDVLKRYFRIREEELSLAAAEIAQQTRLLRSVMERLRKGEPLNYDVTIRTIPQRTAACVRMTLPRYDEEGRLWALLTMETTPLPLIPNDPCLCGVIFHVSEWKENLVDVEAQKTVRGDPSPDTNHVRFRTLPPATVASVTYCGAYEQIGEVHAAVYAWIEADDYTPNLYHVSPHELQNPDEFVTEICCPIRE